MARVGSIIFQVAKIIKEHNGIGTSKLDRREEINNRSLESNQKISDKFHSYKSLDNARRDLINLGKFAKDNYQIKDMSKIDAEIVKNWIRAKEITYNTASNYLSEINKVHRQLKITPREIKELRENLRETLERKELQTRSYKHLEKIELPTRSQPAFELQRDYGLRVNAATHINLTKQFNGNTLLYQEKGGKWSEKELSPTLVSKLKENAVEGKYEMNRETYSQDLKKEIEKTGQKYNGTHGIRHTYAQKQLEAGKTKQEVSEAMGHVREEITNVYLR